jgi:hypothetical protein
MFTRGIHYDEGYSKGQMYALIQVHTEGISLPGHTLKQNTRGVSVLLVSRQGVRLGPVGASANVRPIVYQTRKVDDGCGRCQWDEWLGITKDPMRTCLSAAG